MATFVTVRWGLLLVGVSTALLAEPAPTPSATAPAPALALAVVRAPDLQAARLRADAARHRVGSAGRLPDPEVEGMLSRKQTPMETMPMWEVSIRQPLPKRGERAADMDRANATVAMAEADFAMLAGEVAADTAMALAEAETARRRIEVLTRQLARTEHALGALDARLATGQGRLADRLAFRTRLASMQLMLAREQQMADDATSLARSRLGLRPEEALPIFAAPSVESISPQQAPSLDLAEARTRESDAMARMARASARPMTSVALRFEREREAMGNNDTVGIAFMTELPFRGRRYARADEQAALADRSAAQADAASVRHRINAAISRVNRAAQLTSLAQRLANETQGRLSADYDTLLRTLSTESMNTESGVLMLLDVLEKTTDAEFQIIDAEGALRAAQAELWRYAPTSAFPHP